jgi:hypothetical protein
MYHGEFFVSQTLWLGIYVFSNIFFVIIDKENSPMRFVVLVY